MIIIYVFLFVLGAIVGSFLNVVALRLNSGLNLNGRSFCFSCRRQLRWYELVPVGSYVWQRGKCRGCRTKFSLRYPAVEVWTGLIFATVFDLNRSLLGNLVLFAAFSILVVITLYDLKHKIIPNKLVYPLMILSAAFSILEGRVHALDWAAGVFLFLFFAIIWLVSRGRAMGFGDAKLAFALGLLLGLRDGLTALGLSFWIGMIVTLSFMAIVKSYPLFGLYKRLTMKSEIPFAPFLVIGAWIAFIFHFDLFHVAYLIQ